MAFAGLRGSAGLEADGTLKRRPENWRETLLYLYPNGMAPLTALTSMMKSKKIDDPIFHWFNKVMPDQNLGAADGVTNTMLYDSSDASTTVHASGGAIVASTSYYLRTNNAATAAQFKNGQIVIVSSTNKRVRFAAKVTAVGTSGNYPVTIVAMEAVGATTGAIFDSAVIAGTAYPEGDTLSTPIQYDPSEYSNYTQIFRDSLSFTRTAKKTRLRTGDQVAQAKKEGLELHGVQMERALFLNPAKTVATGGNGQPLRTTAGIRSMLTSNVFDYGAATGVGTTAWCDTQANAQKTMARFEQYFEQIFRYGSQEKIMFAGSGALMYLQQLIRMQGTVQLFAQDKLWGFKFLTWDTPFGTIHIKSHPLFTLDPAMRNEAVIIDAGYLEYKYIDDTAYLPNRQANDLDGENSEYLTEAGLALDFEQAHGWVKGFGVGAVS